MTMVRDVQAAIADLLEPAPSTIVKRLLDVEPQEWQAGHLYVIAGPTTEEVFETGPTRIQRFDLNAVYITDDKGEEAALERTDEMAIAMDNKRGAYMSVVRHNEVTVLWNGLKGSAQTSNPLPFEKRSAAVRISGWRIVN